MRGFLFSLIALLPVFSEATTVVPYQNLKEMAMASDLVVLAHCTSIVEEDADYTKKYVFQVKQTLKGQHQANIKVRNLETSRNNERLIFSGDIYFESATTYLLFLQKQSEGSFQTLMLSYGVFEEKQILQQPYLVPVEESQLIHIYEGEKTAFEPLQIYRSKELIKLLEQSVQYNTPWDATSAKSDLSVQQEWIRLRSAAPSHCNFLGDGPDPRWRNFPHMPLPVWYHEDGDSQLANTLMVVQNSIDAMNANYPGVPIGLAGTHDYNPSCSLGTAIGEEYVDFIELQLGGPRHVVIQFNNPCSDITPLSGCTGTLAIGGIAIEESTYSELGCTWSDVKYGTVIMNDRLALCKNASEYEYVLTHELTHALGFDHISSSSGSANMNPNNPGPITALDTQCVNFVYPTDECPDVITIVPQVIHSPLSLSAGVMISLDSVIMKSNAIIHLTAPTTFVDLLSTSTLGTELTLVNDNNCN